MFELIIISIFFGCFHEEIQGNDGLFSINDLKTKIICQNVSSGGDVSTTCKNNTKCNTDAGDARYSPERSLKYVLECTSKPNLWSNASNLFSKGEKEHMLELLEAILDELAHTYSQLMLNKPCYSAHDLMESVKWEDGIDAYASLIIEKLYNQTCIKREHHDDHKDGTDHGHGATADHHDDDELEPEFFFQQIKSRFGSNNFTGDSITKLIKSLGIGEPNVPSSSKEDHDDHDDHSAHSKRRRRSINSNSNGKCVKADTLLHTFGIEHDDVVSKHEFEEMCPALVEQLEGKWCESDSKMPRMKVSEQFTASWKPWIAAVISVMITNLCSLVGVFTAPVSQHSYFSSVLMFLIALAISTLLGDATLHLLPHSLDLHKHKEGASHDPSENEFLQGDSFIWKCLCFLLGVYIFYLFELLMHTFRKGGHGHSHNLDELEESHQHIGRGSTHNEVKGGIELSEMQMSKIPNVTERPSGLHQCDFSLSSDESLGSDAPVDVVIGNATCVNNIASNDYAVVNENAESKIEPSVRNKLKRLQAVVWMVMIGDAVHNFMDGVAIGVAFSEPFPAGLQGGISTSIAILCHELPHELGDFAVLLNSGVSIRMALCLNFVSSMTALVGGLIGVAIGTVFNASSYIFAATAGLFVYISLVDMLPEILHSKLLRSHPWRSICLQQIGLFIGFTIMFLLSVYEEEMKTMLS